MPTLGKKKWRINNLTLKKKPFRYLSYKKKKRYMRTKKKGKTKKKLDFDYLIFPFTLFIIKKYK